MKRWLIACAALCAFAAGVPDRNATASVVALSIEDLAHGCDTCIRGQVIDKQASWTADGGMIETVVTVECHECLKGSVSGLVKIVVLGGDISGLHIRASEAPTYEIGEEAVVFGRARAGGSLDTYGCFQGKYTILNGMVREMLDTNYDQLRSRILAAR